MDITPQIAKEKQLIESYGNGGFKISGTAHEGSVLVMADKTLPWNITKLAQLTAESFAPLFASSPAAEILLIGCGVEHCMLSPEIKNFLKQKHIAADAMSTGAACRTYNILLAEGRQVAAALIAG